MTGTDPLAPLAGARIALLIESDGPGGAERMVAQLATALNEGGVHPVVFLPAAGEGWLERELGPTGIPLERFHVDRPFSPRLARDLARSFARHRITLAHSHEFTMAVYGAWAAARARIPHVVTMHGGRYYAHRLRRRVALRTALALSGAVAAVSTPLAGDLAADLWVSRSRISVIPNGVRFSRAGRSSLRDELGLAADTRLVVAVGNLYPVKGHRYLVEALALLGRRHPGLHVAIAGRGELAAELADLARARGVADRVHLLGLRADVPNVLAAADVFVLPSLSEGLPLALLEAMLAGRAIVASDVGEVPAALAGGRAGLLVPPGDASTLADAIDRLLSAPGDARALGEVAAARAATEYSLSAMVARYADLYGRAIPRGRLTALRDTRQAAQPALHGRLA